MWRAAARQLGRKRLEQCRSSEHHHSFPFVSNLSERRKLASSALAAAGHVIIKGGDRESAIIDSHWSSLQASTTSLASSGLPLCPSSATATSLLPARTRVDETLDAALYGLVNLPWLFLQSFSGQDSINPSYPVSSSNSSKVHAVAGLDYNRAFVSVAEAVEDDDETEGELETDVSFSKEGKRSTTPALDEAKKLRKKQYELRKRQLKVETEAWQKAAENYKELMLEMCRKNLAPNLPFAQSLLLGWFEPLRYTIISIDASTPNS
jgi:DNA-directed RNA polymerase